MLGFLLSSPSVSESNLNFSYRDNIEAKRSQEIDILFLENKKLKQILEEKSFNICNAETEIFNLKEEIVFLTLKLQSLESHSQNSTREMYIENNLSLHLSEERQKYNELMNNYQKIFDENKLLSKQNNQFNKLTKENIKLRGKIDILEKEIAIHDKTIFDLKVEVRRTPPQESLEFQAELEKIKQVLTTHMEPSIEVKKEICDLKAECLTFKKDLKTKDHQIESIEIMLKTKEQELNEAHLEIEEKTDALTRLSTVIMGLTEQETELREALKAEKRITSEKRSLVKYSRKSKDN